MAKFNKSHLNQAFTLKILKACFRAMKQGIEHVYNRKGDCVLAVRYRDNKFIITDRNNKTIAVSLLTRFFTGKKSDIFTFVSKRVAIKEF